MPNREITSLLEILQCPITGGPLEYDEKKAMIYSREAQVFFPIEDGIPVLLESRSIKE